MRDGFRPGGRLEGELRVPGSKSIAQRALVAAALAHGTTRVRGAPENDDVRACAAALTACGVDLRAGPDATWHVVGRPPGSGGWSAARPVDAGESGTGTRLLVAALAFAGAPGQRVEVAPRGSLRARSSAPLLAALERAGVVVERGAGPAGWPVRLRPCAPPDEVELRQPLSSQELSALLVAAAAFPREVLVRVEGPLPSRPYVGLTVSVLRAFGARVRVGPGAVHATRGPLRAPQAPFLVEPDASSAAVALVAACLADGELLVPGLRPASFQGDVAIVRALAQFGCRSSLGPRGLRAGGRPTRGARLDLEPHPDLAPPLAALAMAVALGGQGETTLTGLSALARKESPRVAGLAAAARALGLRVGGDEATLVLGPGERPRSAGALVLDARGDHRMAFAFALLGLALEGVTVEGAECVAKSWPGFWDDLERVGARRAGARAH